MPTDLPIGVYSISSAAFPEASVLFSEAGKQDVPATVKVFAKGDQRFQWTIGIIDTKENTYTIRNGVKNSTLHATPALDWFIKSDHADWNWVITPTGVSNEYTISFIGAGDKPHYWTLPYPTRAVEFTNSPLAPSDQKCRWILNKVSNPVKTASEEGAPEEGAPE